jgi:predicted GIY-YIG superfamily endonuclease
LCFVYSMTSLKNGKVYVGVTCDTFTRFRHHRYHLNTNTHRQADVRHHFAGHRGVDVEFAILDQREVVKPNKGAPAEMTAIEAHWIRELQAVNAPLDGRFKPKTIAKWGMLDVDWAKSNRAIARTLGCSGMWVEKMRLAIGRPSQYGSRPRGQGHTTRVHQP